MIKRIVVGFIAAASTWAVYSKARRWRASWGFDATEAARGLPGDELVSEPTAVETHGLTIAAPPEAVWPWLVQMGYGRGGWYSYDAMDMQGSSSESIVPELQTLKVGDTVPTDPVGGFLVKVVEPERALVLYIDHEIVAAHRSTGVTVDPAAPGLALSGRFLETATSPEFSAAWAFVLEPIDGGQTRLIERFRARISTSTPGSQLLAPALGLGVFVMTRRQMLGIKARAEKLAKNREILRRDVDAIANLAMAAPIKPTEAIEPEAAPAT